jgi:hypothetical protein
MNAHPGPALLIAALLSAPPPAVTNERLTLRVTPNISSAPTTLVVRAYVEPDPGNRRLRIEADNGSFYRSSEIPLDGDNAPMLTEFRFKSLPSGHYTVMATLIDAEGKKTVARRNAIVLPRGGER